LGAHIFLGDWLISLFVGGALSITAVAISLTTLIQIDAIRTRFGITILNAAIADDVIGILVLSFLLSFARTGDLPNFLQVGGTIIVSVAFVLLVVLVLPKLSGFIFSGIRKERVTEGIGFSILVAGLVAVGAHLMGLHLMIGALLGGMAVRDSLPAAHREALNRWSFGFFAPVFFAWVGFSVTFAGKAFSLFTIAIIVLGFMGKFLGAGLGAKLSGLKWSESMLVGIGMNGRAGVELVLVAIALQMGLINRDIYSAVVYTAIVMSLLTPVLLKAGFSYFKGRGSIIVKD
jgi:Kef-type K+ transport system membrane component KefB